MVSRRLAAPAGSAAAAAPGPAPAAARSDSAESAPAFPGCRPVRITRDAIADHEGRIEYWNAATETAWVAREPTTVYHEGPGQQLIGLLTRIAAVRGAPILTLGTADLLLRDAQGQRQRILQADQIVLPGPGGNAAKGRRRRGGRGSSAGSRAGGGLRDRRAAGEAGAVRGVGLPGGVGRGSGGRFVAPPAGSCDPSAGGGRLPGGGGQRRPVGLDRRGDPRGSERSGVVGGDARSARTRGPCPRRGRGDGARRRCVARRPAPRGARRAPMVVRQAAPRAAWRLFGRSCETAGWPSRSGWPNYWLNDLRETIPMLSSPLPWRVATKRTW